MVHVRKVRQDARVDWCGKEYRRNSLRVPAWFGGGSREMRCRQGWATRTTRTGREPSCSWALATSSPVVQQTLVLDLDDAGGKQRNGSGGLRSLQSAGCWAARIGGWWLQVLDQTRCTLQVWLLLMLMVGGYQAQPGLALNILSARGQCRMGSAPVRSVITKPQFASPDRPAFQYRATLGPSNPPTLLA